METNVVRCKVRDYVLIPDMFNPGKPKRYSTGARNIIYSHTAYFPVDFQPVIYADLKKAVNLSKTPKDLEKRVNDLIVEWGKMVKFSLTKPLFPKKNLGMLIGDPFFNFY